MERLKLVNVLKSTFLNSESHTLLLYYYIILLYFLPLTSVLRSQGSLKND